MRFPAQSRRRNGRIPRGHDRPLSRDDHRTSRGCDEGRDPPTAPMTAAPTPRDSRMPAISSAAWMICSGPPIGQSLRGAGCISAKWAARPRARLDPLLGRHLPETGDLGLLRGPMTLAGTQPGKKSVFGHAAILGRNQIRSRGSEPAGRSPPPSLGAPRSMIGKWRRFRPTPRNSRVDERPATMIGSQSDPGARPPQRQRSGESGRHPDAPWRGLSSV